VYCLQSTDSRESTYRLSALTATLARFMKKHTQNCLPMGRFQPALALVALTLLASLALPPSQGPLVGDAGAQARTHCSHTGVRPARVSLHYLRRSVRCLVNRARGRHKLRSLRISRKLRQAATGHSRQMVKYRFFSHGGLGGSTTRSRIAGTGYFASARSYSYGEVITAGCHRRGSPKLSFRRWMRSSPHRAEILTPQFREIGVGVARRDPFGGGGKCATYTVDLGVRR
jgi:uncharacterized protein YkwD